ncbi:MAG: UDP-glucose 4-epimerase GalE [Verrucomicrobiia bacterium]|jgi:UDP-glucose 4-epimerase
MNVLVTGGAGYIGSVCVEQLLNLGHNVVVVDNLSEGHRQAVDERAIFVKADLEDSRAICDVFKNHPIDAVMHFAALALVGESMEQPGRYFKNNVYGALNLLEAGRQAGIKKFVFSSTCATYGIPDKVPITEDQQQNPLNPYGESKLMFEKILKWYNKIHGLEFVAFRYFNAAGATEKYGEDHKTETHLIPNVLKVVLGKKEVCEIYGTDYPTPDGTCVRDYIHVYDLATAHIAALKPGIVGYYNLGNGEGYSVREVIKVCEKVTGKKIPVVEKPRRPGDAPKLVASAEKARRDLNWTPIYPSLEQIVSSAWNWHRSHPNGYKD